ncbi:MAG: hypothetical protein ACYS76_15620, partial [Planctomycetota bacterium]
MKRNLRKQLTELLKELHLPMFRQYHAECAVKAMNEGLSYEHALLKRLDFWFGVGRFMLYEYQKKNDQIAGSASQRGTSNGQRRFANLLSLLFAEEIYS